MSEQQRRLVIGGLAIGLAIASVVFLAHGFGAGGVLCFALHIVVFALGTRPVKKVHSTAAVSQSTGTPKPASAPPDGHLRFTVVVENLEPPRISELWSDLRRPERADSEPIRLLFRNFTVLEANRFRFRTGDPKATAALLADVLSQASGVQVRTSLEPAAERTPIWS